MAALESRLDNGISTCRRRVARRRRRRRQRAGSATSARLNSRSAGAPATDTRGFGAGNHSSWSRTLLFIGRKSRYCTHVSSFGNRAPDSRNARSQTKIPPSERELLARRESRGRALARSLACLSPARPFGASLARRFWRDPISALGRGRQMFARPIVCLRGSPLSEDRLRVCPRAPERLAAALRAQKSPGKRLLAKAARDQQAPSLAAARPRAALGRS